MLPTCNELIKTDNFFANIHYLTIIVDKINGPQMRGIFTSYENAAKYMYRLAINFCANFYNECHYQKNNISNPFTEYVNTHVKQYYELIIISHLDPFKPIYLIQCQCCDLIFGKPHEYLTNSFEHWQSKQLPENKLLDSWIKICTLNIDPVLPELGLDNF